MSRSERGAEVVCQLCCEEREVIARWRETNRLQREAHRQLAVLRLLCARNRRRGGGAVGRLYFSSAFLRVEIVLVFHRRRTVSGVVLCSISICLHSVRRIDSVESGAAVLWARLVASRESSTDARY